MIEPQAKVLAEARGIACIEVDYDELRGIESHILELFRGCSETSGPGQGSIATFRACT